MAKSNFDQLMWLASCFPLVVCRECGLAYYNFEADVLLLSMTNVIPDHFAVYELGFDASSRCRPQARAVGIHHPGGVPTAISTVEPGCVHHEGLNAFERLVPGICTYAYRFYN